MFLEKNYYILASNEEADKNGHIAYYDLITFGVHRSYYGHLVKNTESFGERYICTIYSKDLEDAKRIKKKYLG